MWLEPQPTEVLSVVLGMFERFGAAPQCLFDLEETIQIDRGKCMARSYRLPRPEVGGRSGILPLQEATRQDAASTGDLPWTEEAGETRWYLYRLSDEQLAEEPSAILSLIRQRRAGSTTSGSPSACSIGSTWVMDRASCGMRRRGRSSRTRCGISTASGITLTNSSLCPITFMCSSFRCRRTNFRIFCIVGNRLPPRRSIGS